MFSFFGNSQEETTNVLNNAGEICTVIYGSENITVNNNFQYYLPEDEIKKVNKTLIDFIKKHDFLTKKERKIIEKELNVDAKTKDLKRSIKQHESRFEKIEKILLMDTTRTIPSKEIESLLQIMTLAKTATENAKCLSEDYDFESYEDRNGNIVYRIDKKIIDDDPNYIFVYPFHESVAIIRQYEKFGFINSNGDIIVPIKYDYAEPFSEGRAIVGLETFDGMVYFFINTLHKKMTPDLIAAKRYENGIAWAKVNSKKRGKINFGVTWGGGGTKHVLLDKDGKILRCEANKYAIYDSLYRDNDNWISIVGDKYGILSDSGVLFYEPQFNNIGKKSNLFRSVQCQNGTWGYLNEKEELYLRCLFQSAGDFKEDKAIISISSENAEYWGVINKEGGKVIKPIFNNIVRKKDNGFLVTLDNENFNLNQYGVCTDSSLRKKKFKRLFIKN